MITCPDVAPDVSFEEAVSGRSLPAVCACTHELLLSVMLAYGIPRQVSADKARMWEQRHHS